MKNLIIVTVLVYPNLFLTNAISLTKSTLKVILVKNRKEPRLLFLSFISPTEIAQSFKSKNILPDETKI
jgi:hypothetical protein